MTQGVLSNAKSLKFKSSLTEAIPDLTDDLFVRENIAIIHIYHENLHFLKHERGEVCLLRLRIYCFFQVYYLWPFDNFILAFEGGIKKIRAFEATLFLDARILDVLYRQQIKLFQVVSTSKFHEYWWNDLENIFLVPAAFCRASEARTQSRP